MFESAYKIIRLFGCGMFDCFKGVYLAYKFLWPDAMNAKKSDPTPKESKKRSKRHEGVQRTLFEVLMLCLGFGFIYSFAIIAFDHYFLGHFIKFLTSFLTPDDEYYYWWFSSICSFQFNLCWTILLFLLSRILTYSWYQEVADLTYAKIGMKASNQQSFSYALSDQINSAITQSFFLVQAYVVYVIPLPCSVQHLICLFHLSLLYALYAFEYKWVQKGYGMNWRLSYVESKWPYFVGFGLPLSLLTFKAGSYISSICLFSTFFPFYVMSSTITCASEMRSFNQPLKVFKIVTTTSDFLVGGLIAKALKVVR